MSTKLSIEAMLSQLEKREKHHSEREAFHAEQEVFHGQQQVHHREQRAVHVAELEKVREGLATFRAAAASAVDLVGPVEPPAPPPAPLKLPPPGKKFVSGLLRLVVENPELQEPFGPAAVAAECNRRFRSHLKVLVDPRTASDVLRRLAREGHIQLVRKGKARHEALYKRRSR
jgi:ribosomal protein S25